jgi:hypothetical protein
VDGPNRRRCLTLERYVRQKQIELARSLQGRAKIYLDLNFWIALRETAAGRRTGDADRKLLHFLRRGVARGKVVCPISDSVFMELLKQPFSEDRRIGTARLVDELSLGVTLINSRVRTGTEISSFFLGALKSFDLYPMQDLVWTRLSYVLGETHPFIPDLEPLDMLTLQKAFVDRMWRTTLTEMVLATGEDDQGGEADPYVSLSAETNQQRDLYASEITDFASAYDIEIRGGIDAAGDLATEIICDWSARNNETPPPPSSEAWLKTRNMTMNLLAAAFAKDEAKRAMRTLHIHASLHAAMRCDKPRRFKPNDFYDFQHATAAIGYCDAFFTEAPLAEMANRLSLGLRDLNGCRVTADVDEAVECVRALRP